MFPELIILSQRLASQYKPTGPTACISIVSPDASLPELSADFTHVHRARFDDVPIDNYSFSAAPLTPKMAEELVAFVQAELTRPVSTLMIHCYYGASRSAGVALGIADGLGYPSEAVQALEESFPVHNKSVRALIHQAFLSQSST